MNKKLRFSLLALLMAVFSGVWAEPTTETITLSEQGYGNAEQVSSTVGTDFTITYYQGTSSTAPAYYDAGSGVRVYAGGYAIVSSEKTMTKVVFTFAKNNSPTVEINGESVNSPATWEGEAKSVQIDVKNKGQMRLQSVTVTFADESIEQNPVASNVTFDPMTIVPGDDGMYTISADYEDGASYNVTVESSDEDMLLLFTSGDHIGEFIAGNTEGTVTVTVTITPTGDNAANFTAVTETFEVAISDPREAIATINSLMNGSVELTELTVNSDYPSLTADLTLAEGVSDGDYVVSFETESDLIMIEDDYCYVGSETGTAVITVTVTPTDDTIYKPVTKTFEVTITDPNAPGTENNPYTVAEALEFINGLNGATSDVVYVKGVVSKVESITSVGNYWLSDTGFTSDMKVYKGNYLNDEQFHSNNEVKVGDIVVVKGKLSLYGGNQYQFNAGNYVYQHIIRTPIATSITAITPSELQTNDTGSFGITWELASGANTEDYEMTLSTNSELITLDGFSYTVGDQIGTADITVTVTAVDQDTYSNVQKTFTVNIIGEPILFVDVVEGCGLYKKVTSNDQLVAGHRYLIAYDGYASAGEPFEVFNGVDLVNNNSVGTVASVANTVINSNQVIDARSTEVVPVVLQGAGNTWYMQAGDEFLAYTSTSTSGNNYLYTVNNSSANGTMWNIDVNATHLITNLYNTGRVLQYNTGSPRFACYNNGTQKDVVLFMELTDEITSVDEAEELTLTDDTYAVVDFKYTAKAGWNTIALPFDSDIMEFFGNDIKVYQYNGMNDEGLQFVEKTSSELAWGIPVVFYIEEAPVNNVFTFVDQRIYPYAESVEEFIATYEPMSMAGKYGVVPTTGQIKKGGPNSTIKAFRGYFDLPTAGEAVNAVFHDADGTTTSIKAVELFSETQSDVYDLGGRKVNGTLQPGVYVKDGKKVVVK